jgi:hypothetical protein
MLAVPSTKEAAALPDRGKNGGFLYPVKQDLTYGILTSEARLSLPRTSV